MDEHQQGESLSNYSDVSWQKVINVACLDVMSKASDSLTTPRDFTQSPEAFLETVQSVLRLPAELIEQAIVFEQKHAKVCQETKKALPSMPVEDAWCNQRKKELKLLSTRCVKHIGQDMCKHWSLPSNVVNVSRSRACDELLEQIDQRWEEGQRQYYASLDGDHNSVVGGKLPTPNKRKRGPTAEDRLRKLMDTEEGWSKILAAGTDKKIGKLIERKRGAVIRTKAWTEEISPRLRMLKEERKIQRRELDERRCD